MFKEWRRKNTLKKKHSKSRNSRTFPCSTASCAASTDPKASIPLATKVSVKRLAAVAGQAVQKRLRMGWPIKRLRPLAFGVQSWHQLCGLSHNEPCVPVKLWFVCFKVMDWWETKTCYSLLILLSVLCPKGMQNWVPISPWHLPPCLPQYLRSSWSGFVSRGLPSLWHLRAHRLWFRKHPKTLRRTCWVFHLRSCARCCWRGY